MKRFNSATDTIRPAGSWLLDFAFVESEHVVHDEAPGQ